MLTKALLISALGLSATLSAATYQWDANGATAGLGGDGNWVDANWDNTASGANDGTETPVAYTFTTADTALFGGTAGTVTVAAGTVAGTLKFDVTGYTLTGGSIALDTAAWVWGNYATHDIIIGAGNTVTINSNLTTTTNKDVSISSGVSGAGTGTGGVMGGTVVLGGVNTFSNDLYVYGATLEVNNLSALGFASGKGLVMRNWEIGIGNGADTSAVSTFRYTGSTATFANMNGNGGQTLIGQGKYVFDVTQAGTALTLSSAMISNNNKANTLEKTGAGTLILSADNTYSNTAGGTTGGTIITAGTLQIGSGGTSGSAGTGAITNNAALVFNRSDAGLTVSSVISGTGTVTQGGSGTTILTGANTYSGATNVNTGALRIGHANALGTTAAGTTVASGAALEIYNGITTAAEALTLNGTGVSSGGALRNTSGTNTYAGAITLASAARINSDTGATLTVSGAVNNGGFGLTVGGAGATTISGLVSGTGGLTKDGAGTLTLSNAGNSFAGNVTVSAGTVKFGAAGGASNGALGALNAAVTKVNVTSGATVDFNGYSDNTYGYTIAGTGVGAAGALVNTGATLGNGVKQAVNVTLAADASIGGTADWALLAANHGATNLNLAGFTLTKVGANTVSLDNTTITAGNIIVSAGGLRLGVNSGGSGSAISGGQNVSFAVNAGTLYADQRSATIGSLSGTGGAVNIGSGFSLTVGALNTSTAFAGVVSGAGDLTKNGTGTLTLSGANTYTGATTVSAGKLAVTGTILVNAAGGVTIASAAELALSGTLKLNSASASLANSGTLTAGGILDLGGQFNTFNGGADGSYNLITGTAATGSFSSIQGYDTGIWSAVSFDSATGKLNFTAVPEPSTYGLLGAGALAFVAFVRRRRRSAR